MKTGNADMLIEAAKNGLLKPAFENTLSKDITTIEQNCENCMDYVVCYAYGTLNRPDCQDWQPDLETIYEAHGIDETEK